LDILLSRVLCARALGHTVNGLDPLDLTLRKLVDEIPRGHRGQRQDDKSEFRAHRWYGTRRIVGDLARGKSDRRPALGP
jgi:hypothetical protein